MEGYTRGEKVMNHNTIFRAMDAYVLLDCTQPDTTGTVVETNGGRVIVEKQCHMWDFYHAIKAE